MAIKKPPSPPSSVGRQLVFAAATAKAVCGRMLEPHGLSLAQWAVLVSIWQRGALGVKDLAMMTGNEPPAVSRLVDRMILAGLLHRQTDGNDRRAVVIELTAKGEALRPLQTVYEQVNAVLLAGFTDDQRVELMALLGRLESNGQSWLSQPKV